MQAKKWYLSKTIWFNILSGIVGILTALTNPNVGLSSQFLGILAIAIAVANILLRAITTQPVTFK